LFSLFASAHFFPHFFLFYYYFGLYLEGGGTGIVFLSPFEVLGVFSFSSFTLAVLLSFLFSSATFFSISFSAFFPFPVYLTFLIYYFGYSLVFFTLFAPTLDLLSSFLD
jgi:hypothetical protein